MGRSRGHRRLSLRRWHGHYEIFEGLECLERGHLPASLESEWRVFSRGSSRVRALLEPFPIVDIVAMQHVVHALEESYSDLQNVIRESHLAHGRRDC